MCEKCIYLFYTCGESNLDLRMNNIYWSLFYCRLLFIKGINYFHKRLHLRYMTVLWIHRLSQFCFLVSTFYAYWLKLYQGIPQTTVFSCSRWSFFKNALLSTRIWFLSPSKSMVYLRFYLNLYLPLHIESTRDILNS